MWAYFIVSSYYEAWSCWVRNEIQLSTQEKEYENAGNELDITGNLKWKYIDFESAYNSYYLQILLAFV